MVSETSALTVPEQRRAALLAPYIWRQNRAVIEPTWGMRQSNAARRLLDTGLRTYTGRVLKPRDRRFAEIVYAIGTSVFFPGLAAVRREATRAPLSTTPLPPGAPYLWYKADALLFSDDAGTTPCADATDVHVWKDSGSAGIQQNPYTAGGNRPLYNTNVINGYGAVTFDGNQGLIAASTIDLTTSTMLAVCLSNVAVNVHYVLGGTGFLMGQNAFANSWVYQGGGVVTGTNLPTGTWMYLVGEYPGDNATIALRKNGSVIAGPGAGGSSHITNINLGYDDRGGSPAHGAAWMGKTSEAVVYSGLLNSTDRGSLESYASAKFGI